VDEVLEQERVAKKRKRTEEQGDTDEEETRCEIRCVNQKSSHFKLRKEIADELLSFNFQIDPDFLPISEHALYTQVLIDFKPVRLHKILF
jgi:hypothetical protein